jgi:hypothetical protein
MDSGNSNLLPQGGSSLLARQLRVFGVVLLVLYGANCLNDILPLQILNPLWQIGVANSLVNNAGIAGTGLILLHLAQYASHDSGLALDVRKTLAGLTTMAALGFLLLIPLQISAVTRGLLNVQTAITQQEKAINRQADRYRTEIRAAPSTTALQQRMVAISGPVPGSEDLRTPLPELKQNLLKLVDLEAARLKGNINRVSLRQEAWVLAKQSLRICISALALALGFGVLAQQDSAAPPLLVRLGQSIRQLPVALQWKRRENEERAFEKRQRKRFLANMARMGRHRKRLDREIKRKQAGSWSDRASRFFRRFTGQNEKGWPRK